jgi:hypothetical protein
MNNIKINGLTITGGRSVVIANGHVIVDGKDVTGEDATNITIEIHGDVAELSADACNTITVNGSAGKIKTQSGSVRCGDVAGSVQTMSGSVVCGAIGGDVSTMSGDVVSR